MFPFALCYNLITLVHQVISLYADAVQHSYQEAMTMANSNISVHHALHQQLADLEEGMGQLRQLMEQKCRTMMFSLPRTS
jgi:uncharacterized membrane protein